MISVQRLCKKYQLSKKQQKDLNVQVQSIFAVKDVSFECKPGRIFSLLGPNGAGKTTTLRMIATILKPSSGEILVGDRNVKDHSREVRKKIGFLTGSTNLYDRLTPSEIVQYFGDLYGMDQAQLKTRKEILFEKLGINDFLHKRIGQLSTGMKQKVSIARSMIHDPEVVIFDEPTSGLDVITAHNIIDLIRTCKKEGKTVIFSSHIMSEVDLLCDDLAIINKGTLIYNNSMEDYRRLSKNQSLTETFIHLVNQNQP
jgi:sodium transport system ATP-binding protein